MVKQFVATKTSFNDIDIEEDKEVPLLDRLAPIMPA